MPEYFCGSSPAVTATLHFLSAIVVVHVLVSDLAKAKIT
jgi:hypothetical protein